MMPKSDPPSLHPFLSAASSPRGRGNTEDARKGLTHTVCSPFVGGQPKVLVFVRNLAARVARWRQSHAASLVPGED